MRDNLKDDSKEIRYHLYKNEDILLDYINQKDVDDYEAYLENNTKVEDWKALSDIRKNIIRWYPFKNNSTILEIGAHLGEITGMLCEKAERVVAVEFSEARVEAIRKRNSNKENLAVLFTNLFGIKLEEKFDYVTLINILEYAEEFETTPQEIIQYAKQFLKSDGRILIVTDNKLGMRSWSNIQTDITSSRYQAITSPKNKLLTRETLDKILMKEEFSYVKYYYVLPDANFTNVIFTDDILPTVDTITRNITIFDDDEIISFHENNAYSTIIKDSPQMFSHYANTFFIEVGNTQEENNISYVSFGNLRKPKYRIQTVIQKENVYKQTIGLTEHFNTMKRNIDYMNQLNIKTLDSYDNTKIISRYAENEITVDKLLITQYQKEGKEAVKEFVKRFFGELKNKLTKVDSKNNVFEKYKIDTSNYPIEELNFIKEGLWDLTFQNCFYIDNEFYFYDQEWFEENIPIEFLMYRNILYFHELKQYMQEEEWYKELNILKFKELFELLDSRLQIKIRDNTVWKITNKPMQNVQAILNKNAELNQKYQMEYQKNKQWKEEKQMLLEQLKTKEIELSGVYNSKSWKTISKIRNIIRR